MINFNADISNVQQLEFLKQAVNGQLKVQKATKSTEEVSEATKVDVSNLVTNPINQTISVEDVAVKNLSTARTIYDALADIRLQLADMMKALKDPDVEHTVESLEEMDVKSNTLIEKAINVVKDNDKTGLVDNNYLNIFMNGLTSLKELKITNDDYLTKIFGVMDKVIQEQDAYYKVSQDLYSNISTITKNYEQMANKNIQTKQQTTDSTVNSSQLQKQIVNNIGETLKSVTGGLSAETVMRLLQG